MPAITTDPDVALALWMQLHDSAFPTGRMVHSQGLEQWLVDHPGADRVDIEHVVTLYLTNSYAPLDATIAAAAWRATNDLQALREAGDALVLDDAPEIPPETLGGDAEGNGEEERGRGVVVASAPPEEQRARVLARPGMTDTTLGLILSRQMPDEIGRAHV